VPVVVAARERCETAAARALTSQGAQMVERHETAPGRVLLYAATAEPERAVAALRASGWRAAARPDDGGHLSAWQRHTAPVVVAGRLSVCFPWSEFDRAASLPTVEIDPGASFGTGAHPSTLLLLDELARRLQGGEQVLDVGCGSGVLAVAAARLGATAFATDIDAAALAATARNAEWNDVDVTVSGALPDGRFDAIVANIGADALVELAPEVMARASHAGWVGLSGLSPAQLSRVAAAYGQMGDERSDGEWAALILHG
jgi:ribosomal protein L11 methyltransferase